MKKLKAFTVIELIMSLLISSVVIAIAFYAFLFLNKQFIRYNSRSGEINEYIIFKTAVENDLKNSEYLLDSTGLLVFKGTNNSDIIYQVSGDYIVRQNEFSIDTFKIANTGFIASYDPKSNNIINGLLFKPVLLGQDLEIKFDKPFSAEQLMKAERYNSE